MGINSRQSEYFILSPFEKDIKDIADFFAKTRWLLSYYKNQNNPDFLQNAANYDDRYYDNFIYEENADNNRGVQVDIKNIAYCLDKINNIIDKIENYRGNYENK